MRFLLDENVEFRLAGFLQSAGHDVTAVAHEYPQSLRDDDVLAIAVLEQRILITNDRDFGELIFRQRREHCGVVYFRMQDQSVEAKLARLTQLLGEGVIQPGVFLVVTEKAVRVRRAPTIPGSQ
jgi:predicted nuclease of predicted toxin-antitoxin system